MSQDNSPEKVVVTDPLAANTPSYWLHPSAKSRYVAYPPSKQQRAPWWTHAREKGGQAWGKSVRRSVEEASLGWRASGGTAQVWGFVRKLAGEGDACPTSQCKKWCFGNVEEGTRGAVLKGRRWGIWAGMMG